MYWDPTGHAPDKLGLAMIYTAAMNSGDYETAYKAVIALEQAGYIDLILFNQLVNNILNIEAGVTNPDKTYSDFEREMAEGDELGAHFFLLVNNKLTSEMMPTEEPDFYSGCNWDDVTSLVAIITATDIVDNNIYVSGLTEYAAALKGFNYTDEEIKKIIILTIEKNGDYSLDDLRLYLGSDVTKGELGDLQFSFHQCTNGIPLYIAIYYDSSEKLNEGICVISYSAFVKINGVYSDEYDYYYSFYIGPIDGESEGTGKTLNNLKGLDDFLNEPSKLKNVKPDELYNYLKNNGYDPQPLSGGSYKGVSFEDGGGFKVNWGGDRILQYHPAGQGHHGGFEYWKISSGPTGTIRYDMNGNIIK